MLAYAYSTNVKKNWNKYVIHTFVEDAREILDTLDLIKYLIRRSEYKMWVDFVFEKCGLEQDLCIDSQRRIKETAGHCCGCG